MGVLVATSKGSTVGLPPSTVGVEDDDGADDGCTVDIMGMLDGGSVGDSNGDDDGTDDDGALVGESVSDGDGDKVLTVLGLVVGYLPVGCDVDSAVGMADLLVGKIVISVGTGVKGLVGVGLTVDVIVGILLLRLLVGPNVMVGIAE